MQPKALLHTPQMIALGDNLRGGTNHEGDLAFALGWRPARSSRVRMCAQEGTGDASTDPNSDDLAKELEQAIAEERYEDAARLRDLIKPLHPQPVMPTGDAVPGEASTGTGELRHRLRQIEINRLRDIDPGGDNMATPW